MLIIGNRYVYNNLFLFFNEYVSNIDRNSITSGYYSKNVAIYYILVKDLNSFSERKTNLGLFNLSSSLSVYIHLHDNNSYASSCILPPNMKLTLSLE